jgi:hypothetical protein
MQLMEVHMQFNLGIFRFCKDKWGAIYGYFKHFDYMLNISNNSEYWILIPQEKTMFNLLGNNNKKMYEMIDLFMGVLPMFCPPHIRDLVT